MMTDTTASAVQPAAAATGFSKVNLESVADVRWVKGRLLAATRAAASAEADAHSLDAVGRAALLHKCDKWVEHVVSLAGWGCAVNGLDYHAALRADAKGTPSYLSNLT